VRGGCNRREKIRLASADGGNRILQHEDHYDDVDPKAAMVFPLEWCRREGLELGGPLNVFDMGPAGLLIRPVRAPSSREVASVLAQTPAGRHSPEKAREIVERALREVRST
jgi:hypothetical protein